MFESNLHRTRCRTGWLVFTLLTIHSALLVGSTGTVTISKCEVTGKTNGGGVDWGLADADKRQERITRYRR